MWQSLQDAISSLPLNATHSWHVTCHIQVATLDVPVHAVAATRLSSITCACSLFTQCRRWGDPVLIDQRSDVFRNFADLYKRAYSTLKVSSTRCVAYISIYDISAYTSVRAGSVAHWQ